MITSLDWPAFVENISQKQNNTTYTHSHPPCPGTSGCTTWGSFRKEGVSEPVSPPPLLRGGRTSSWPAAAHAAHQIHFISPRISSLAPSLRGGLLLLCSMPQGVGLCGPCYSVPTGNCPESVHVIKHRVILSICHHPPSEQSSGFLPPPTWRSLGTG